MSAGSNQEVMTTDTTRPLRQSTMRADDTRVAHPIFTLRETAAYLGIPKSTVQHWAGAREGSSALITRFASRGRDATVPFIGFAEAYVLSAFRRAGVPLQRIRPAVERLASTIGIEHALASHRLYTDGAEVLYDYASEQADEGLLELFVVRTQQRQFSEVVTGYLRCVTYGADGWASAVRLPVYGHAAVVVDARVGFGLPLLVHGGARVEDLIDRFQAGDGVADIAEDFGVPEKEVEDVVRVATRVAA